MCVCVGGHRCSLFLLRQVDDVVSTEVEQTVVSLSAAKMDEVRARPGNRRKK